MEDGIVDVVAEPEQMLDVALGLAANWAPKAKMGFVIEQKLQAKIKANASNI